MFDIQRQTCRHCVVAAINRCLALGLKDDETFYEVRDVCKGYFCFACLRISIDAGDHALEGLRLARSCHRHETARAVKLCPCRSLWANCLHCMLLGDDPRAGTAICHRCLLRHGAGAGCCRCRLAREAGPAILRVESSGSSASSPSDDEALVPPAPPAVASLLAPGDQDRLAAEAAALCAAEDAIAAALLADPTMRRIAAPGYVTGGMQD